MKLSISVRQAIYVLVASLCCGFTAAAVQIYYNFSNDRLVQEQNITRSVDLHRDTLGTAAYILDKPQADEILSSLLRLPQIKRATLVDDFGDILSSKERKETHPMTPTLSKLLYWVTIPTEQSYSIKVGNNWEKSATLNIVVDKTVLAHELLNSLLINLTISALFTFVLTLILITLSHHHIAKPVMRTAQWVKNLNNGGDNKNLPYSRDDELGDLVRRFSIQWHENQTASFKLEKMLENLKKSERFSRTLMENSSDAMFLCHTDLRIHQANNLAEALTRRSCSYLVGKSLADFSQLYTKDELEQIFIDVIADNIQGYEDSFINNSNDQPENIHLECRATSIEIDGNSYVMVNARDCTEKIQAQNKIHELAYFDSLTHLANRRLFSDQIDAKIQHHIDQRLFGALLYFDLDQFKKINDSLGHSVGDQVLVEVAARIRELFPTNTLCGRIGGDEFVVGLLELADNADYAAEKALQLSNQLLSRISSPVQLEKLTLHTTASIGIASFPDDDINSYELLRRADTAMYKAKSLGRNGIQFFKREMQYAAQHLLELEEGIHNAILQNQFEIWLQPQVRQNGQIFGAEVLVRWNHPKRGLLMPGVFIPHAEESGLIIDIDKWVLRQSISSLKKWQNEDDYSKLEKLAINVSPTFFLQVDFVSYVIGLLEEHIVSGEHIVLEITENLLLNNFELAKNKMLQLKNRGISFSIDDFGTGYSSLKYLKELPLDELKIDRSFVIGLTDGSNTHSIVEVVVTMAKNLNMGVIAEGVETPQQLNLLNNLGCNQFQGYHLGYPEPWSEFRQYFLQKHSDDT